MLIRNSKNSAEQEAKRMQAMKMLEIEASNEAYLDSKVSSYRNPNEPPAVPPRYRDASEIAKDVFGNQLRLINLLISWGFTSLKANAIVKNIKSNDDVLKILQAQGNIKRRLDSYNKELLSVEFVSNIIEKFLANYDKTMGGNVEDAMEMMLSSWASAKRVFPTREQINLLKSKLSQLKEIKQKSGLNTISIDSSIESLNKYEKLLPVIENYESLKESGIKSEAVEEMKALLNKGNIPLAVNINQYIGTVNELLEMSKNTGLNRADTDNKLNKIDDALKYTITPEAQAIIMGMKKKLNLPEGATEADVIIGADKEINKLKEEDVKKDKDTKRRKELADIEAGRFFPKGIDKSARLMRAVYRDNNKSSTGTTPEQEIIYYYFDRYLDDNPSGKMTYQEIVNDINYSNSIKHNFLERLPSGGNNKANGRNGPDTETVKNENNASIANELKINKDATEENAEDLDKLIYGQLTNEYFEGEQMGIKPEELGIPQEIIDEILLESVEELSPDIIDDALIEYDKERLGELNKFNEKFDTNFQYVNDTAGLKKQLKELMFPRGKEPKKQQYKNKFEALIKAGEYKLGNFGIGGFGMKKQIKGKGNLYTAPEDLLNYQPQTTSNQNTLNSMIERGQDIAYEVANANQRVRDSLGAGTKAFNSRKIKIGKGLELEDEPKFISFGKYLLNKPHLYNDSKLTLRFPSGGAIPTIKPVGVSEDFKEFLIDLIESGKANEPLYKSVPKEEKLFFQKITKGAGLVHKLGVKQIQDDSDAKDLSRYKLLFGELQAGNNNRQMINELKGLILKFINNGRMKRTEGQALLFELSQI